MKRTSLNIIAVLVCAIGAIPPTWANTFVGNGGNAGDVELIVTRRQVQTTLEAVVETKVTELCECLNTFKDRTQCEPIQTLNEEQKQFCSRGLKFIAPGALELLANNKIQVNWTHEKISVVDEDRVAAADAVSDPARMAITINQDRFLALSPSERIFLFSHELFHLVDYQGQKLKDRGEIGPFKEAQGQKRFINSMASGVIMQADLAGQFKKYAPILRRPQGHKENWLDAGLIASNFTNKEDSVYALDNYSGLSVEYRRYFGGFGVFAGGQYMKDKKDVLTQIKVEETVTVYNLGLAYKFFPFSDPLTRLGQSYLSPYIGVELLDSEMNVKDNFNDVKSSDQSLSGVVGVKYLFSIGEIWGFGGVSASPHKYQHKDFGLEKNSIKITATLGASYGF